MSRILVAVFGALLIACVGVGCQDKDKSDMKGDRAMKASADVCPACPGMQKATADGKCPGCGAKVASASMSGDACSHCPGMQTATADGKCPACGAAVAAK